MFKDHTADDIEFYYTEGDCFILAWELYCQARDSVQLLINGRDWSHVAVVHRETGLVLDVNGWQEYDTWCHEWPAGWVRAFDAADPRAYAAVLDPDEMGIYDETLQSQFYVDLDLTRAVAKKLLELPVQAGSRVIW